LLRRISNQYRDRKQNSKIFETLLMNTVNLRLRPNGPIVVEGAIKIIDGDGNSVPIPVEKTNIALCRCGLSQDKPFCDGAHRRHGWCEQTPSEEE
jgi:CDGSH-type Zn-finger protein